VCSEVVRDNPSAVSYWAGSVGRAAAEDATARRRGRTIGPDDTQARKRRGLGETRFVCLEWIESGQCPIPNRMSETSDFNWGKWANASDLWKMDKFEKFISI